MITNMRIKENSVCKATFDVDLKVILIKNFRILQKTGMDAFIVGPQVEFQNDGKRSFFNIVDFSNETLKKKIDKEAMDKYQRLLKQKEEDDCPF